MSILETVNFLYPDTIRKFALIKDALPNGIPYMGGYVELFDGATFPPEITQQQQEEYENSVASQKQINLLKSQVRNLLEKSDLPMLRIQEAVSLGLTTWAEDDVIAWINYRRELRNTFNTGQGIIPKAPSYPQGT